MSRIEHTDRHRVFPVERRGDTLVVAPRGDAAGFGQTDFQVELSRVMHLLERSEIRHLIVDLGGSNYYGATMIGALVDLGQKARARGGQTAFCNASQDMRDILRLLRLDVNWQQFDSRPEAVRALATEPRSERMRAHPVLLAVAAALLLAAGAVTFSIWRTESQERHYHKAQHDILRQAQELHERGAPPAQWRLFAADARRRLTPMVAELEETANSKNPVRQYLLFAGRDHLLPVLEATRFDDFAPQANSETERHFERAAAWLNAADLRLKGASLQVASRAAHQPGAEEPVPANQSPDMGPTEENHTPDPEGEPPPETGVRTASHTEVPQQTADALPAEAEVPPLLPLTGTRRTPADHSR